MKKLKGLIQSFRDRKNLIKSYENKSDKDKVKLIKKLYLQFNPESHNTALVLAGMIKNEKLRGIFEGKMLFWRGVWESMKGNMELLDLYSESARDKVWSVVNDKDLSFDEVDALTWISYGTNDAESAIRFISEFEKFGENSPASVMLVMSFNDRWKDLAIRMALMKEPANPVVLKRYVQIMEEKGEYKQVVRELMKILFSYPKAPAVYSSLARVYLNSGKLRQAEFFASRALKIMEGFVEVIDMMAEIKRKQGKPRDEAVYLMDIVESNPWDFSSLIRLAVVFSEMGELSKAEDILYSVKNLALVSSMSPYIISKVANGFHKLGKLKEAEEMYKLALENIDSEDGKMREDVEEYSVLGLSKVYIESESYHSAVKLLEDFRSKYPDKVRSFSILPWLYFLIGNYDRAMEVAREIINNNPEDYDNISLYAQMLYERGYWREAAFLIENLIKVGKADERDLFRCSKCYEKMGDYDRAIRVLKPVVDSGKADFVTIVQMARLYDIAGYHRKALRIMKNFLKSRADDLLSQSPEDVATAYKWCGMMEMKYGNDPSWAKKCLESAAKMVDDPEIPELIQMIDTFMRNRDRLKKM